MPIYKAANDHAIVCLLDAAPGTHPVLGPAGQLADAEPVVGRLLGLGDVGVGVDVEVSHRRVGAVV